MPKPGMKLWMGFEYPSAPPGRGRFETEVGRYRACVEALEFAASICPVVRRRSYTELVMLAATFRRDLEAARSAVEWPEPRQGKLSDWAEPLPQRENPDLGNGSSTGTAPKCDP